LHALQTLELGVVSLQNSGCFLPQLPSVRVYSTPGIKPLSRFGSKPRPKVGSKFSEEKK
jgi:hypothetical protein